MKKFILSLGLVAMMLNLTNCAQYDEQDITPAKPQGNFELFATITRTTNSGLDTVWEADDALSVFHAEAGTTEYVSDGEFAHESTTTGRFLGSVAELTAEAYDWFAIYPYNSYNSNKTPAKTNYTPIGSKYNEVQTQTGNNSMAHIAGSNYPLAGVDKGVANGTAPALKMKNVASLLEVEVKNTLDEAITVSEIKFTAPERIVGTFYINLTDIDNIVTTSSGDSYTVYTATLEVEEGVAIEKGASAKFYLAVAPFTAAAGSELSVSVYATSDTGTGVHSKTLTLNSETTFASGKIKPLKVNYNTVIEAPAETIDDVLNFDFTGLPTSGSYTTWSNKVGTSGAVYAGNSYPNTGSYIQIRATSPSGIVTTNSAGYVRKVTITWNSKTTNGRYVTIYGKDSAYSGSADLHSTTTCGTSLGQIKMGTSTELTITGNYPYIGILASDPLYMDKIVVAWEKAEIAATPVIKANDIEGVAAEGVENATATITTSNLTADIVATCDGEVVTSASATNDTLTYTVSANTGNAREGWIELASDGATTVRITVSQEASNLIDYSGVYMACVKSSNVYYALAGTANGTRLTATVVDYDGATYTTENPFAVGDNTLVWTIAKVDGGYTMMNNDNYVEWTSGNTASLSTTAYNLTITENEDGTYGIFSAATAERKLQYNASAKYFAFYTSPQVGDFYLVPAKLVQLASWDWGVESLALESTAANGTLSITTSATSATVAAYDDEACTTTSTWLTVSYSGGVVSYSATENSDSAARTAYIKATATNAYGDKEYTLAVTQSGKPVAGASSYTLSSNDISTCFNQTWAYAGDPRTFAASDGSEWVATSSYRNSKTQNFIQIKKNDTRGNIASPVVSGKITKVVINVKGGSSSAKFSISGDSLDNVIVSNQTLTTSAKDYTINISEDVSRIFIQSDNGTIYVYSITIYCEY